MPLGPNPELSLINKTYREASKHCSSFSFLPFFNQRGTCEYYRYIVCMQW